MGCYSWKTADTKETIYNMATDKCRPVYLLQPGGLPPIFEGAYEGYGVFGGIHAYAWLAKQNASLFYKDLNEKEITSLGLNLQFGCYQDVHTKQLYSFRGYPGAIRHGSFDEVVSGYNLTANELIEAEQWVKYQKPLTFPLKFSFDKEAVYEALPESADYPTQGYFDYD